MTQKMLKAAEKLGWEVREYKGSYEFAQYTPAGEDYSFSVNKSKEIAEQVFLAYMDFDVDEHVEMWVEARRNRPKAGIPSIRVLCEDAEEIENMLYELAFALHDAE